MRTQVERLVDAQCQIADTFLNSKGIVDIKRQLQKLQPFFPDMGSLASMGTRREDLFKHLKRSVVRGVQDRVFDVVGGDGDVVMREVETSSRETHGSRDAMEVDEDSDDEYLPSSDLESEEEDNDPSSSSSPVGPFTPRTSRYNGYTIAITRDPASDDITTSSSPTRKIRRMARAERLSTGLKVSPAKMNNVSPASQYLSWTMRT